MVDVTDHELVPEHTVLDEEAVEEVLEEYNVQRTDLPKIKFNPSKRSEQDPALRALDQDVEPGDVVRIERDSRTAADTAVVYRLVVE